MPGGSLQGPPPTPTHLCFDSGAAAGAKACAGAQQAQRAPFLLAHWLARLAGQHWLLRLQGRLLLCGK